MQAVFTTSVGQPTEELGFAVGLHKSEQHAVHLKYIQ